jgi:prepilin-type N-terminal cleavage/methylation domain-containing protein
MNSTLTAIRGRTRRDAAGFTLIELLTVIAIMAVLAAIALPSLITYMRIYKIRGAQQQVAGQIQGARNRAINKNVNQGVALVIESPTAYWVHIEDDMSNVHSAQRQMLDFAAPNALQSTRYELPRGVRFAATAAECAGPPAVAGAANGHWFRFNRLGAACSNACGATPVVGAAPASTIWTAAASGSQLCVYQPDNRLSRFISIAPGGRVATQK